MCPPRSREGAGDKRPRDQIVWILRHLPGNRIPGSPSAPKLGPDKATLVRSVHILNKHNFLGEVHHRHIEDVNIPGDGGRCIPVVTASVVQLFDRPPSAHPWCPAKAIGQRSCCRTRLWLVWEAEVPPSAQRRRTWKAWEWTLPSMDALRRKLDISQSSLGWKGLRSTSNVPVCLRAALRCHQEVA